MSNLLFVYENEMPTVSISRAFWSGIDKKFGINSEFISLKEIKRSDIDRCDVLFMIRPNNCFSWKIASKVRKTGRTVITMCDDDLLNLPASIPHLPWQRNGLIKALNNSDVFISNSKYLAYTMAQNVPGGRWVLIDTVVRPEEIIRRNNYSGDTDIVRIVYAAGSQHEKLFEKYVLPALKELAEKLIGKFSLTFVSVSPKCGNLENMVPITYVKGMPLEEYRKYMEDQRFDIGISPLEDDDFSKCKYFNKYLEYTLSGVAGIYSNVEPYTYVVKNGFNGILADNTQESWKHGLEMLIKDSLLRKSCAINAQEHVADNFNEDTIVAHIIKNIPELQESHEQHEKCRSIFLERVQYSLASMVEFIYKTFFYLSREGMKSVGAKIIARLKR